MQTAVPQYVVLDTCVLMSTVTRHLLLRLAQAGVFTPVWSAQIGVEWCRNAARVWGVSPQLVQDLWQQMQVQFPHADCGDYQAYEHGLKQSDPKDRHVIAAGLAQRAKVVTGVTPQVTVLTWNIKDFHRAELRRLGMQLSDPDRFLWGLWSDYQEAITQAVALIPQDLLIIGRAPEPLVNSLRRDRLYRFLTRFN